MARQWTEQCKLRKSMEDNRGYLTLVLMFKWYDMIASGVKLEEYRDFKPYYQRTLLGRAYQPGERVNIERVRWELETHAAAKYRGVILRKGYNTGEELKKDCTFRFDYGNPDWGAQPKKLYFIMDFKI